MKKKMILAFLITTLMMSSFFAYTTTATTNAINKKPEVQTIPVGVNGDLEVSVEVTELTARKWSIDVYVENIGDEDIRLYNFYVGFCISYNDTNGVVRNYPPGMVPVYSYISEKYYYNILRGELFEAGNKVRLISKIWRREVSDDDLDVLMSLGVTVPEGECEITGSLWGGFTKNPDGSATPHDSSDSEPFTFPIPPMGESVSSPVKIFYKFFPLLTNLLQYLQDLPNY